MCIAVNAAALPYCLVHIYDLIAIAVNTALTSL
jgi:hypothetical protein